MKSVMARNGVLPAMTQKHAALKSSNRKNLSVSVDLGLGTGATTVYTSDLTHDYISINADLSFLEIFIR